MRISILGFIFFFSISNYSLYCQSTSPKYDIGFVLRGYAGSNQFDSINFDPYAKEIVRRLNELSFDKISTYRIFLLGADERSPTYLQGLADIETLQASLDGWPGAKWDWLRTRTGFWYVVPVEYRPIISNAIIWLKSTKKSFGNWQKETIEGVAYGDKIQSNVIRMGPSSAADYLKNMKLPVGYNPNEFKTTFVILNSNSPETITGGGAQWTLQNFGILNADSSALPVNERNIALYVFADDPSMNGTASFFYTVIHEGIHAFGMGTHDQDPQFLNTDYGVMSSYGAAASINTLPAWDRYFWNKWLPKSTITTKQSEVSDLKDKGKASDSTLKYILEIIPGDARGCGGTYKELYDGKWYTYKVDAGGTLTFTEGINNENKGAPKIIINPFNHKVTSGDKIVLRSIFTGGTTMNYVWKKNGEVIAGQTLNYLTFNKVQLADSGSYTVTASNTFGSVTTSVAKLEVALCAAASMRVLGQTTSNICLKDSIQLSLNVNSSVQWYKDGNAINGATNPSFWVKSAGFYNASITYANGCISEVAGARIYGKPEKPIFNTDKYAFCSGDSLKLSITNVNKGDSLKWYFGTKSDLTNVANKTFTESGKVFVTRTDSLGCIVSSDTIQLNKYAIPGSPTLVRDSLNNLVASTNGITWFKDGVKITDTAQKFKPTSNGIYTATTTQNGCTSSISQGYYYLTNAVPNFSNGEYFKVSPNPTSGELNINYKISSSRNINISIFDINGRTILLNKKLESGSKVNLGSISKGNYIIQVKDKTGRLITSQKLVKE